MVQRHRRAPALAVLASFAAVLTGCLGSEAPDIRVTVNGGMPAPTASAATAATAQPQPTLVAFTPPPVDSTLDLTDLHGFIMPVEGACLPTSDALMPNAPREYRSGVHEGIDFYFGDACVVIERGTPVVAAHAGTVVRADHTYVPLTLEEVQRLTALTESQGFSDPETLDVYRGRQVWIDHGDGVVTRYCHLDAIAPDIAEGTRVEAGQPIGAIGDSGTPESVTAPGTELHLHFEVRVGDGFLGEQHSPDQVRALYRRLFEPAAEEGGSPG